MTIDMTFGAFFGAVLTILGLGVLLFCVAVFLINLIKGANHDRRSPTRNISDARLKTQVHQNIKHNAWINTNSH